jgi:TRAP transporter 4TM/12TM fusion protein
METKTPGESQSEKKKGRLRDLKGFRGLVISVLTLAMAVFQFYTAYLGAFTPMLQRGVHLAFGIMLIFLLYPPTKGAPRTRLPLYDILLAMLSVCVFVYAVINFTEPSSLRMFSPTLMDKVFGITTILLVLEAARRSTGMALPAVIVFFILYAFLGNHIPGAFGHAGVRLKYMISNNYMSLDGIFGPPTGASAKTIFVLVIFGVTMLNLGGGEFLIKASFALFGTAKGGPAKIAVAASALFATITGVGPSNVAATGVFTIPLMKKVGYRPQFAGAVEAAASSGGQIMPPVMGIAAFIMAEILGITYLKVCLSALIPAILYFVAVYMMVHLEAVKLGLKGMSKEEPREGKGMLLGGWDYGIPLILLILMIGIYESSPQKAGFWAMIALIGLHLLKRSISGHRFEPMRIIRAIESGVLSALVICAISSAVGIIMSVINLTGIGLKLSTLLIALSHGKLIILLVITMFASLILGMGMTTVACYIIVAVLAAPALVQMGVDPIAAHLFVFYFGIMSAITPPVAMSSFVAASIADSSPMRTALESLRLGLAAFILPYIFVYNPMLLLQGNGPGIALAVLTSLIGIVALAMAIQGCFFNGNKLGVLARVLLFFGSILLIWRGAFTDLLGFLLVCIALGNQLILAFRVKGLSQT